MIGSGDCFAVVDLFTVHFLVNWKEGSDDTLIHRYLFLHFFHLFPCSQSLPSASSVPELFTFTASGHGVPVKMVAYKAFSSLWVMGYWW